MDWPQMGQMFAGLIPLIQNRNLMLNKTHAPSSLGVFCILSLAFKLKKLEHILD